MGDGSPCKHRLDVLPMGQGFPVAAGSTRSDDIEKTPSWINAGNPLELRCRIADQGETCQGETISKTVKVGGVCDTQMRPVTGVK